MRGRRVDSRTVLACWVQVKHFDRLKDKEVRVVRVLHDNINQRSAQARGGLAGEELNK